GWVDSETFPSQEVEPVNLYLTDDGLSLTPPSDVGVAGYRYDPEDPAPTIGGATLRGGAFPAGPRDQSPLAERGDVLSFATSPLSSAVRVAGWVQATLWVESDAPLTDFVVRLIDIHEDGTMLGVTDGILRSHFEQGKPSRIEIDLWATDYAFAAGHRIGIQVTSSSFPRWQRAMNVDEPLGQVTQGRVANQQVYFGGDFPSSLRIGGGADWR
ncbi:MAG: CocE/NonD family hydrolase, partial [Sphingobium sp.]